MYTKNLLISLRGSRECLQHIFPGIKSLFIEIFFMFLWIIFFLEPKCECATKTHGLICNLDSQWECTILKVSGLSNPIIIWKSYLTLFTSRNVSCILYVSYVSFCKALSSISLLQNIIIVRQFIKCQFIEGNLAKPFSK